MMPTKHCCFLHYYSSKLLTVFGEKLAIVSVISCHLCRPITSYPLFRFKLPRKFISTAMFAISIISISIIIINLQWNWWAYERCYHAANFSTFLFKFCYRQDGIKRLIRWFIPSLLAHTAAKLLLSIMYLLIWICAIFYRIILCAARFMTRR